MLSNKAMLVYLGISQWTGRKLDKRATGTVEASHATQKRVGNYTKKLLPGARELDAIQALAGALRKFYYDNTLPWAVDGARILSSKNYMDFMSEFQKRKSSFDETVQAFLVQYPKLRDEAKSKLGDLFNEREYPNVFYLERMFKCEMQVYPLPEVGDFRTEILDTEREAFLKTMSQVETQAMRECWTRLHDVVKKAAQKLSDPNAIFRDSLIENISEMCQLLPKLNITDDQALEDARREVEAIASAISTDTVRENQNERQDAVKKLNDLTDKMSVFMGVA
jgi:hypothetical protein